MSDQEAAASSPGTPHAPVPPTEPDIPSLASSIYRILKPLDADTRTFVLQGAFGMLGLGYDAHKPAAAQGAAAPSGAVAGTTPATNNVRSAFAAGPKAQQWLTRHGLTDEKLEQVFHRDNDHLQMYANLPGSSKRESTLNAYLLTGALALLVSDEPRFSETDVVTLCRRYNAYDKNNHAATRASFSTRFTGAKESGFLLTPLGQAEAASLIKAMTESAV